MLFFIGKNCGGGSPFDPRIGRFLSEDPLWDTNLYSYVLNNPVNWIDPWGLGKEKKKLSWWEWWLYESALPGSYYGQPMSEWGPSGPTGGFTLMKYTEEAGGAWMWAERAALGISAGAAITAGGLIAGEAITGVRIEPHLPHLRGPHRYPHFQRIRGPGWGKTIGRWPRTHPWWWPK